MLKIKVEERELVIALQLKPALLIRKLLLIAF